MGIDGLDGFRALGTFLEFHI